MINHDDRQRVFFCFCGPAGSGKTTICYELLKRDPGLMFSVSTTTRTPRTGELDGRHYFFVNRQEFERRIECAEFLEFAEFDGNLYGTEKRNASLAMERNRDLLLDIEVEGAKQLKDLYGDQVVVTFVFPPSFSILGERLSARGTESEERVKSRLEEARREVGILRDPKFSDYLLINDDIEESLRIAQEIVEVERRRLERFSSEFIEDLVTA